MQKFIFLKKEDEAKLPKRPGVYIFEGKSGEFLYIGKASNIRERVRTHLFQPNYRDDLFIKNISKIGFFETWSEIEALLLESELIKKHRPRFNVVWKDDKNYFFIGITKEKLPKIFITHQKRDLIQGSSEKAIRVDYIGPFVDGRALKKALKFLRKVFPYYTLQPHPKTSCPYCHLNLCPGPNPDQKEYRKNVRSLIKVLEGKKQKVLLLLQKEMNDFSKSQDYEKAAKLRDQIRALESIISNARILDAPKNRFYNWNSTQKILGKIINLKEKISRIEAYDISNIQGKKATGSMVTFINGRPAKDFYRKFKIRIAQKPNDVAMIKEVLSRRFQHPEWPFPDLILIDGGKPQLNAALSCLSPEFSRLRVITLAKRKEELYTPQRRKPLLMKTLPREVFNLILHLRDEAHRFAISYHRKLRDIDLIKNH